MTASLDRHIVRYCSPTLAGLKCGSMFRLTLDKGENIVALLRRVNRRLACKGVNVMMLSRDDKSCMLYVFRWSKLTDRFSDCDACALLREKGYKGCTACSLLIELRGRFAQNGEFPHEVGLFLDYPTSDVRCFLCNSHTDGCACGVWKAYSNKSDAEETFRRFEICKKKYERLFEEGLSIEDLTIAG